MSEITLNYATYNLPNEDLDVFPIAKPRTTSLSGLEGGGRLFYEHTLATLFSILAASDGYIVSYDEDSQILDIMLKGYHFTLDISDLLTSRNWVIPLAEGDLDVTSKFMSGKVFVRLSITNDKWKEIAYSSEGNFEGLTFIWVEDDSEFDFPTEEEYSTISVKHYYLQIFDIDNGELKLHKDSMRRFDASVFNITKIDGKHN